MSFQGPAMVLAAGRGVRMDPLTRRRAKPALPVLGRTLLERIVTQLAGRGVRRIAVNAHHGAGSLRAALERLDDRIPAPRLFVERELMGSGGALAAPKRLLASGPTFLLHNGDTLADPPLDALDRAARQEGCIGALLVRPRPVPPYGPILVEEGLVTGLARKGGGSGRPMTYLGIAVFRRELLERVPERPADLFTDLLLPLLRNGRRLAVVPYDGPWLEFTAPESFRQKLTALVERHRSEGAVPLPGGAAPVRAVPEGAVHIGPGARLGAGAVPRGGVVLEAGARVAPGAIVDGSVLLEGASVGWGARVTDAVVGEGAGVPPCGTVHAAVVAPSAAPTPAEVLR